MHIIRETNERGAHVVPEQFNRTKCGVSSWKGQGEPPEPNRCKLAQGHQGLHKDGHGNHYDDRGQVPTLRQHVTLNRR